MFFLLRMRNQSLLYSVRFLVICIVMIFSICAIVCSDDLDYCEDVPAGGTWVSSYPDWWVSSAWQYGGNTYWESDEVHVSQYDVVTFCFPTGGCSMGSCWVNISDADTYEYGGSQCYAETGCTGGVNCHWTNTWNVPGATIVGDPGGSCNVTYDEPGIYTASCTVYDTGEGIADDPKTYTWNVTAKAAIPAVPDSITLDNMSGNGSETGNCSCPNSNGVSISLKSAEVTTKVTYPGGEDPGTGGDSSTVHASGSECVECYDTWSGLYAIVWNRFGQGVRIGPVNIPSSGTNPISFSVGVASYSGTISSSGSVQGTFTYTDGSTTSLGFSRPGPPFKSIHLPQAKVSAAGLETTYNRTDTEDTVTTPNGDVWVYGHVEGDSSTITSITSPDGTYVKANYVASGDAAGKLESVRIYTSKSVYDASSSNYLSTTDYTYYTSGESYEIGKLDTVTINGGQTTKYSYSENGEVITVQELNSSNAALIETVYDYREPSTDPDGDSSTLTTTVTRKNLADSAKNEVTYYCFNTSSGKKTVIRRVIDPLGNTTTYNISTSTLLTNLVTDSSGMTTYYNYNTARVPVEIIHSTSSREISEINTYYTDASGHPTIWLKTHQDVRGNYTHYDRATATLSCVDAIKVASGPDEPTDWSTITPIKQYEYYTADCTDGMKGQLEKEIVLDIDGTTDQVTEYKYGYSVSGKWRTSPTSTIYTDTSGTSTLTTLYDAMGRVISDTDANGKSVAYAYDSLGRQILTIHKWTDQDADGMPDYSIDSVTGELTSNELDVYSQNFYSCCALEWSRDENGKKTFYDYDDAKRVIGVWTDTQGTSTSSNRLVTYTYDSLGNQSAVTTYSDASTSRATTYTYDKNNRVTKIVYPHNGTEGDLLGNEEFGYDEAGNLNWKMDGNGDYTFYKYDDLNRLTDVYYDAGTPGNPITYPTGNGDVHYDFSEYVAYYGDMYDYGSSLVNSITDSTGTSYYHYDIQGQLVRYVPSIKNMGEYIIEYAYNNLGQKKSIKIGAPIAPGTGDPGYDWYTQWPDDYWMCNWTTKSITNLVYDVSYDYYANGWLKDVKSGASTISSYGYDHLGNCLTQTNNGNGTSTTYDYDDSDPRYPLESITHSSGSTTLATISYASRDDAGNPLSMGDWTGTWTYGYDDNNRLTSATAPNPVPNQPAGGSYEYDWVGNRVHPPSDPNPMVYNKADQLTSWPGMHNYVYNGRGDLTSVRQGSGTTELRSYTYTDNGLLSTANYNSRSIENFWDASGNRVRFVATSGTHTFVYDITAGNPSVIDEDGVYYIREPNGALIVRISGTSTSYYHFDELGSTRLITDGTGTVTHKYAYDAYGSLISYYGPANNNQPYQYVGQYGYYTHYQEPEFGLLQLGVRFYDPQVGRFTQHGSPYTYTANSPTSVIAPGGKPTIPDLTNPPVKGIPHVPENSPKGGAGLISIIGRAITSVGTFIGSRVGMCSLTFAGTLLISSPAGPKPEDLVKQCVNIDYDKCKNSVANNPRIPKRDKSFFYEECSHCLQQCKENAKSGSALPWPTSRRCNYRQWPKKHPNWPDLY